VHSNVTSKVGLSLAGPPCRCCPIIRQLCSRRSC